MISSRFLHRLPLMVAVLGSLCLAIYLGINEYKALQQELTTIEPIQAQTIITDCENSKDDDLDGKTDSGDPGCRRSGGSTENDIMRIGVNLSGHTYYSVEWPFVDAMKYSSRGWVASRLNNFCSHVAGESLPSSYDAAGWPLSLPGDYASKNLGVCRFMHLHTTGADGIQGYPSGEYTLIFQGEGEVRVWRTAPGPGMAPWETYRIFTKSNTQNKFTHTAEELGISIYITKSNPANPVRNIRIIHPCTWPDGTTCADGYMLYQNDPTNPAYTKYQFHPLFLERIKMYSLLRLMDWNETNVNFATTWSERTRPEEITQISRTVDGQKSSGGVAYEYMADVCNAANMDCWVNMPHRADDTYVRNMATIFRDRLNPNLSVYVEYSNELWNWGGWAFNAKWQELDTWAKAAGRSTNEQYGFEAAKRLNIWTQVWNEKSGPKPTLKRVSAAQWDWYDRTVEMFEATVKYTSDKSIDVLSVAPYFYAGLNETSAAAVGQAMRTYLVQNSGTYMKKFVDYRRSLSTRLGKRIELYNYESGQHLIGSNKALYDWQVTQDAYDAYQIYYQNMYEEGVDGTAQFASVTKRQIPYGSWGALEWQDQPLAQAPKYRSIMDFVNAQNQFVANGTLPPDRLPPRFVTSPLIANRFTDATVTVNCNEPCASKIKIWQSSVAESTARTETISSSYVLSASYTIHGLTENTLYTYSIIAKDEAGNEAVQGPFSFRTASIAPVLYFPFESLNSSSNIPDASTTGHVGVVTGTVSLSTDVPSVLAGKSTKSLRIATTQTDHIYVEVADHETLKPQTGMTFSFWIKKSRSFWINSFLTKEQIGATPVCQFGFVQLSPNDKNVLEFHFCQKNGKTITLRTTNNPLLDGGPWMHIGIIADPDTKKGRFFINGTMVAEQAYDGTLKGSAEKLKISDYWSPFNGFMDDLRFYNRALSSSDITELANGREPLQSAPESSSSRSSVNSSSSSSSTTTLSSACTTLTDPDTWNLHRNAPVSITLKQGTTDLFTINTTADTTGKATFNHASLSSLATASNYSLSILPRGYQRTTLTNLTNVQVLSSTCPVATIKFGDFNSDGSLTVADLLKMLQFLKNGDDTQVQQVFTSTSARLTDLVKLIRLLNN